MGWSQAGVSGRFSSRAKEFSSLALKISVEDGNVGENYSRQLEAGRKTGFFFGKGTIF
jgi:hypothetical protein